MTPPTPPDGYELVNDDPRRGDMAWLWTGWHMVDYDLMLARDLRWIARKK